MVEEARKLKLDELLARKLGIDPPEELIDIIIEYYQMPTSLNVSAAQRIGIMITGMSRIKPFVYAKATKEQILELQKDPNIKRIYFSAPVGVFQVATPAFFEERSELATFLEDSLKLVRAPEAWAKGYTGEGIKIAILDTGICSTHPMLIGKVVAKFQTIDGNIEDGYGHGTHCASIAASVAPGAKLINGKVLDDYGGGTFDSVMQGIEKAADLGADIVSMSLGAYYDCMQDHPMCVLIDSLNKTRRIVVVCAAGNGGPGSNPALPALAKQAIAVGATDKADAVANFSSRGPACNETYPDCAATGVGIIAAYPPDEKRAMSGTSMACPHVSGLMALLRQKAERGFLKEEADSIFQKSCKKLDTTKNNNSGWGRIDCVVALDAIEEVVPPVKASMPAALSAVMLGSMALGMIKEELR